jgi:hypothetical protein
MLAVTSFEPGVARDTKSVAQRIGRSSTKSQDSVESCLEGAFGVAGACPPMFADEGESKFEYEVFDSTKCIVEEEGLSMSDFIERVRLFCLRCFFVVVDSGFQPDPGPKSTGLAPCSKLVRGNQSKKKKKSTDIVCDGPLCKACQTCEAVHPKCA